MSTFHVAEASKEDLASIREIALRSWPVAYGAILSPAQVAYMLVLMYSEVALLEQFDRGQCFLLVKLNARPIGFAGFEHHYRGTGRTRLHKLYVLPEVKGTGAGRVLIEAVHLHASQAGDTSIELNVNRFNPARVWYERQGFHIVRDEVIDIGNGFVMDDHVMERSL